MGKAVWLSAAILLTLPTLATAVGPTPCDLVCTNSRLAGQLVDYTNNHGADRRLYSESLCQCRDLYVYLPPGFDSRKAYPLMIYLHGILQDETGFLQHVVEPLDRAIASGCLPPMIVAAPDGSLSGTQTMRDAGSFFINSRAGNFEDWIMKDVWNFVTTTYPIRPEREAHILAGTSMGGFGAFNLGIKHQDRFKIIIGILPVLNIRWMDCYCRYFGNFDPCCWGWRTSNDDPYEVLGRFFHGLVKIRMADVIYPVFGCGPEALALASQENPIELIERFNLKEGDLDMFIGYAGKDEFNLDAHAESFLYVLQTRGVEATVHYEPRGRHSADTALLMIPSVVQWLGDRLQAYHVDEPATLPVKP